MDLWTPIAQPERLTHNFVMLANESQSFARDLISDWAKGFIDRDGKFVYEFQTTFDSSFWEIYLFAVLKELGYSVDFSFSSPDFVVSRGDLSFSIEAVIAAPGKGDDPAWHCGSPEELFAKTDRDTIVDYATIRLANALSNKLQKFRTSYNSLGHVSGKPFVIGLAPFERVWSFQQCDQAIRRVLYGYDIPAFVDDPLTGEREFLGETEFPVITKPNGSPIRMGLFRDDAASDISAVAFSVTASVGKVRAMCGDPTRRLFEIIRYCSESKYPYHYVAESSLYSEELTEGLIVFHNPYARHPLPTGAFEGNVMQNVFNVATGSLILNTFDGALLRRTVLSMPDRLLDVVKRKMNQLLLKQYGLRHWQKSRSYYRNTSKPLNKVSMQVDVD